MQDPARRNDPKTEKLPGNGEIRIPSMRDKRREREHGRLYKWFDNFWYHHKWKTLISLFLIIVILVCTLQMCQKEETGDISVVLAGPYTFVDNEAGLTSLRQCLARYLPADYDENGIRQVDAVSYMIYSKEQIEEIQKGKDDNGNPIRVNTATIQQNYSQYNTYMMLGETSVLFLDPWLFEEMAKKENDYLSDLSELPGTLQRGAVGYTDKNGNTKILGVKLGETELYQKNLAVSQALPADTVLCLMSPYFVGKSSNLKEYQKAQDFFCALAGIK
jgi:hypothetical protein